MNAVGQKGADAYMTDAYMRKVPVKGESLLSLMSSWSCERVWNCATQILALAPL